MAYYLVRDVATGVQAAFTWRKLPRDDDGENSPGAKVPNTIPIAGSVDRRPVP